MHLRQSNLSIFVTFLLVLRSKPTEIPICKMKKAIVTGGNAGLGLLTATKLTSFGFHVTISVRSADKGEAALTEIRNSNPTASVDFLLMDMNELATVKQFADSYKERHEGGPLHLLVNNAGIMATPFQKTKDGIEQQFQVNHLSHFYLTHFLLPQLKAAGGDARVINLASRAHLRWQMPLDMTDVTESMTGDPWQLYGRSKTCNILFARGLASRFGGQGVTFNALHPGLVDTGLLTKAGLGRGTIGQAIPVEEGVKTILYLSTSPEVAVVTGGYFADCKPVEGSDFSAFAQSDEEANKLWEGSLRLCGLAEGSYGV